MDSIRELGARFLKTYGRLDVLVNNAGIYASERQLTVDGLESTFATNHLAYFLLTNLLLDIFKASAPSRIVSVSSEAQSRGVIDFDDLQSRKRYGGFKAYMQSKLANVLFTYELARCLQGTGVTANCLHPGAVRSEFARDVGGLMKLMMRLFKSRMVSPEQGARTSVYLASSAEVAGITVQYFVDCKPARSSELSYDLEVARRLWEASARLCSL